MREIFISRFIPLFIFGWSAAHAAPGTLTYQGRILSDSGQPLEIQNVAFEFSITNPTGSCILYREQVSGIDMRNSKGLFDTPIGAGAKHFPAAPGTALLDAFQNWGTLDCEGGATYNPSVDDGRKLRVQFYDGTAWRLISPDNVIRAVPFAGYAMAAQKIGSASLSDLVQKSGIPLCTTGEVLTSTSSGVIVCTPQTGGSGSGVNAVSGVGPIQVSGTTSVTISASVGTGAGTLAAGDDARFTDARTPTDNSVSTAKIQDGAVNSAKILDGSIAVSDLAGAGTAGQVLRNNGGTWQVTNLGYTDLVNTNGVSPWPATCGATQFVRWVSGSDSFVCADVVLPSAITDGLWGVSGANISRATGRVGVGTTSPGRKFHVYEDNGINPTARFEQANNGDFVVPALELYRSRADSTAPGVGFGTEISFKNEGADGFRANVGTIAAVYEQNQVDNSASRDGALIFGTAQNDLVSERLRITSEGRVGIGTNAPTQRLDVNGGINATQLCIAGVCQSAWPSATDGSLLTNLNPAHLSGTVAVAKGGTGQTSYTDGQILIGNSTGSTLAPHVLSGDVAMTNAGVTTVNGVKGVSVTAAPTSAGQVLRYAGSAWTPTFISMFDLRSSLTGTAAFAGTGCTASQTLTWTAANDSLTCSSINLSAGQIGSGQLAVARGGTGVASAAQNSVFAGPTSGPGAPTFRALTSADLPAGTVSGAGTSGFISKFNSASGIDNSVLFQDASQRLGIGTQWPYHKLTVDGADDSVRAAIRNTASTSARYPGLEILNYAGTTIGSPVVSFINMGGTMSTTAPLAQDRYLGSYEFWGSKDTSGGLAQGATIIAKAEQNFTGTSAPTVLTFGTTPAGATLPTEKVRITASGNVGIGTTNPTNKLQVEGSFFAYNVTGGDVTSYNDAGTAYMTALGNGSDPYTFSALTLGNIIDDKNWMLNYRNGNTTAGEAQNLAFTYHNGSAYSDRVTFTPDGKVGIGTAAPNYTLHVNGTAGLTTGTSWQVASDIRLKDIHGAYEYGLNEILRLHTVRYSYKANNAAGIPSGEKMTGFIAQEVKAVIPDAVKTREDGFLELNVDPIHWAVVNAVQELYHKWFNDSRHLHRSVASVETQMADKADRAEILALQKENAELKKRLEKIEQVLRSKGD